jgi:hypothetical protein
LTRPISPLPKQLQYKGEFVKLKSVCLSASALGLLILPVQLNAQVAAEKPGSAYLQCDGQPNNVTSGETAARLIGAVTLLGLFAPPQESADASKRKFGAEGVRVCTTLIDSEKREGNASRRIGLILGRAIHQIEARNYEAAIADAGMARREAEAAGLTNDIFFMRSRGRAFAEIEAAALLRMGQAEKAREAAMHDVAPLEYSLFGLFTAPTFDNYVAAPSEASDKVNYWRSRLWPALTLVRADTFDMAGRFADSARVRDAYLDYDAEQTPELNSSVAIAQSAIAHALAGNAAVAAERARAAKANADKRKADGHPESDAAEFVALMDLYSIIDGMRSGDAKTARRLFAARSEWVGPSLGSVIEVNRRLRDGAAPDELIGGLARDASQLWKEKAEASKAEALAKDSNNKTLFGLVPGVRNTSGYYAVSKSVWRTDKSRIILKTKSDPAKNKMELLYLPMVDPAIAMDAYVLHAALVAKSRGHQGFVFSPIVTDNIIAASFRSGNRGQKGFADDLFVDADDVIGKLGQLIPSPERLKQLPASR